MTRPIMTASQIGTAHSKMSTNVSVRDGFLKKSARSKKASSMVDYESQEKCVHRGYIELSPFPGDRSDCEDEIMIGERGLFRERKLQRERGLAGLISPVLGMTWTPREPLMFA